jgi:hypothetical protein
MLRQESKGSKSRKEAKKRFEGKRNIGTSGRQKNLTRFWGGEGEHRHLQGGEHVGNSQRAGGEVAFMGGGLLRLQPLEDPLVVSSISGLPGQEDTRENKGI